VGIERVAFVEFDAQVDPVEHGAHGFRHLLFR
jgi:hypothetical protein